MTVLERLERASAVCPQTFVVHATRGQALLTEVAQLGRYTITNDGIVAFTAFPIADVEEAQRFAAPHLSPDEFVQHLHFYATTLVGEGYLNGQNYRLYLHEDGWRVRKVEGDAVKATYEMDDVTFVTWLERTLVPHAA